MAFASCSVFSAFDKVFAGIMFLPCECSLNLGTVLFCPVKNGFCKLFTNVCVCLCVSNDQQEVCLQAQKPSSHIIQS